MGSVGDLIVRNRAGRWNTIGGRMSKLTRKKKLVTIETLDCCRLIQLPGNFHRTFQGAEYPDGSVLITRFEDQMPPGHGIKFSLDLGTILWNKDLQLVDIFHSPWGVLLFGFKLDRFRRAIDGIPGFAKLRCDLAQKVGEAKTEPGDIFLEDPTD